MTTVERFLAVAAEQPDAPAIRRGTTTLRYRDVVDLAGRVAAGLASHGVGPGALVGLHTRRRIENPALVLGILARGAGYLPLDPTFPAARLAGMVDAARPACVLDDADELGWLDRPRLRLADLPPDALALEPLADPEDVAYVLFTSGSTGGPKGVEVRHRNLDALLDVVRAELGVEPGDSMLAITALSFDIATAEHLVPLVAGATVVVAHDDEVRDARKLRALVEVERPSILQATPATWRMLVESGWSGDPAVRAVSTGEALPRPLADVVLDRVASLRNFYGPTETTVFSTVHHVRREDGPVPIGRPFPGTTVLIVDEQLAPIAEGETGELLIGGAGVARGYLGRPDLTDERFVVVDVDGTPARHYRTGDVVRWRDDGELHFGGRLDHQIKLRGHRIELPEIEIVLGQHDDVRACAVIADQVGEERTELHAFVVASGPGLERPLRDFLLARLPRYMVPARWTFVDDLPLSTNGKVDRQALARLAPAGAGPAMAPAEAAVAGVLAAVLARPALGRDESFFEAGGDSLLALEATAALEALTGRRLDVAMVIDNATPAAIAVALEAAPPAVAGAVVSETGGPTLSTNQRMRLRSDRAFREQGITPPTNVSMRAFLVTGELDRTALRDALGWLNQRHELLRMTVTGGDGDEPVATIGPPPPGDLRWLPASATPAEAEARLGEAALEPFDLGGDALLRVHATEVGGGGTALAIVGEHLVVDDWSLGIAIDDLSAAYGALVTTGRFPVLDAPRPFGDWVRWQRAMLEGEPGAAAVEHWRAALGGDASFPIVDLPSTIERGDTVLGPVGIAAHDLESERWRRLQDAAGRAGTTPFCLEFAAVHLLLHALLDGERIRVPLPSSNRTVPGFEHTIGFFSNISMTDTTATATTPVREVVEQVRGGIRDTLRFQYFPYDELACRLPTTTNQSSRGRDRYRRAGPPFVTVNVHDAARARLDLAGTTCTPLQPPEVARATGPVFVFTTDGDAHEVALRHRTDQHSAADAAGLLDRYLVVLDAVVTCAAGERDDDLAALRAATAAVTP